MKTSSLIALIFFFLGYQTLKAETYYFSAPSDGSYATELAEAITNSSNGDEFVLTTSGGSYSFNGVVNINTEITIKAEEAIDRPVLSQKNSAALSVFNIISDGTLHLISLAFISINEGDTLDYAINISSQNDEVSSYSLIARDCQFNNFQVNSINAEGKTLGEYILFQNCFFHNSSSIGFSLEDNNDEASFLELEMQSCSFSNCQKGAFSLPFYEEVNYGTVLINHCVFDSVSTTELYKILIINSTSELTIINSVFSNSPNPDPYVLDNGGVFDYCNFYRCNDFGNATGAHCYYYNPMYDEQYFVTNESLFNKGNDGANIGPLVWEYTGEEEDTTDIGDNPNGYENQGVWVVPVPDSLGQWESYFLKHADNGKLIYREDKQDNIIPDFSYVGYMRGEKPFPEMEIVATISPIVGDATEYIQAVIDSVSLNVALDNNGERGVILIKSGVYELKNTIHIKSSGIILRGEGQNEGETILKSTTTNSGSSLLKVGASGGSLNIDQSSVQPIAVPYIPVGAKYVIIPKGHDFSEGDAICIFQQFNDKLITDLKMDQIPEDGGEVNQWEASDYKFNYEREVIRVSAGPLGDSLIFYNPIVMALDAEYNAERKVYKCSFNERIRNCGVEKLLLKSIFASNIDENHAWNAIYFDRAEHCWAKQITSKYFAYSCVNVSSYARYITTTQSSFLSPKSVVTGGRRYSFNCNGQTSLFTYCYASEGRHDYVTGARVCGPNVFSHCKSVESSNDIGPHHRWSVGTLYDMVSSDGKLNIRDRSNYGTGHGWAGANQVLWNCSGESAICQNPWVSAKNYCIGFTGQYINDQTFGDRPRGEWNGVNISGLNPQSLYIAQKVDRGLNNDFGLSSNRGTFINDSSYQIKFNQPFNTVSALVLTNYFASGNAGVSGNPFEVTITDSITISLFYSNTGVLDYNTQIKISVEGLTNQNNDPINGLSEAIVIVPDLRPTITMEKQELTNGLMQYAKAKSDHDGAIYLLFVTQNPTSVADMELAVENNLGTVVYDVVANIESEILVSGLGSGYYYAYAVNTDGRMSEKSNNSVFVDDALSINKENYEDTEPIIYAVNSTIHIDLSDFNFQNAQMHLYDLRGQILHFEKLKQDKNKIPISASGAIGLIRLIIDKQEYSKMLFMN